LALILSGVFVGRQGFQTKINEPDAAAYKTAVTDLCRFAKQSTRVQEQLPKTLKHKGDTGP